MKVLKIIVYISAYFCCLLRRTTLVTLIQREETVNHLLGAVHSPSLLLREPANAG